MDNISTKNEEELMEPVEDKPKKEKKKTRFWTGFFVGVLITLILLFLFLAAGFIYLDHEVEKRIAAQAEQTESGSGDLDYQAIVDKLALLKRAVDHYFLFPVDTDDMETGIYRGMIDGLGDPYTVYYTPEEYGSMIEKTEGQYSGIGVLVSQNVETGIVTVLRVFPGSTAEQAGILKDDILYKINGVEASTVDLDLLVSEQIRGEEGTTIDVVVIRGDEELEFEVARGTVDVETVYAELLEDGKTGYIIVGEFDVVTASQFEAAVEDLMQQGMKQLVIDMRDNPGGVLDTAVAMIAYILPDELDMYEGTLVSEADRNGRGCRYYMKDGKVCYGANDGTSGGSYYPVEDGHEVDIPIAILINGNTASAAELFSGALSDYGAARLVGTTTFGKGIVQGLFPMSDGSALKITTAHYYTPSGMDLHEKGLEPDLEVEYEVPEDVIAAAQDIYNSDNQLAAAIELLNKENEEQ